MIKHLGINLNDIYGRAIPGVLLLISSYYFALKFSDDGTGLIIENTISGLCQSSTLLFVVTLALASFVVGHVPLYIVYAVTTWLWPPKSPIEHIRSQNLDPTKGGDLVTLFENRFSKDALESNDGHVFSLCVHYLERTHPELYKTRKTYEAGANLRAGLVIPCAWLGCVLFLYGLIIASIVIMAVAVFFCLYFVKSFKLERRMIIWLYYVANLPERKSESTATTDNAVE